MRKYFMGTAGDVDGNPPRAPMRYLHIMELGEVCEVEDVAAMSIHAHHCPGAAATGLRTPAMLAVCSGDWRCAPALPAPGAVTAYTQAPRRSSAGV